MPKHFPPGRCGHCLKFCDPLSSDHVLPESWYPRSTPKNVEKWQMPSCADCNQKYGRIEEELRLCLALGLDPTASESSGVVESVHRSLDPSKARKERDRQARLRRRQGVPKKVIPLARVRPENVMPGFGPHPGMPTEEMIPIGIPKNALDAFAEKLVRGATYVLNGAFVEQGQKIVILPPMYEIDQTARQITEVIKSHGSAYDVGPGFRIGRGRTWFPIPPAGIVCQCDVFRFEIWRRVIIYACLVNSP